MFKGEIERIESLLVDWGLNRENREPKGQIRKSREAKIEIKFLMGFNCMKSSLNFFGAIKEFLKDQIIFLPFFDFF